MRWITVLLFSILLTPVQANDSFLPRIIRQDNVDSLMKTMSLDEKIAQILLLRIDSQNVTEKIPDYNPGMILFGGVEYRAIENLTQKFKDKIPPVYFMSEYLADYPLLAEPGFQFPHPAILKSINDAGLTRELHILQLSLYHAMGVDNVLTEDFSTARMDTFPVFSAFPGVIRFGDVDIVSVPDSLIRLPEKMQSTALAAGKFSLGFQREKKTDFIELFRNERCVIVTGNMPKTIAGIKNHIRTGNLHEELINRLCRKALQAKYQTGYLLNPAKFQRQKINDILNSPVTAAIKRECYRRSLQVQKNNDNLLPLKNRIDEPVFVLYQNAKPENLAILDKHIPVSMAQFNDLADSQLLRDSVLKAKTLLVYLTGRADAIELEQLNFELKRENNRVILVKNQNSDQILIRTVERADAVISLPHEDHGYEKHICQLVAGAMDYSHPAYQAYSLKKNRLEFDCLPAESGMDQFILYKVDSIIEDAIKRKAFPGCQLLVARKGKVLVNRSYGYHTYSKRNKVNNDNLYDLASITKILSPAPLIMKEYEKDSGVLNASLGESFAVFDTTDKKDITVRELLLHESGLMPWISFYFKAVDPESYRGDFFSRRYSRTYSLKMGRSFYVNRYFKYKTGIFSNDEDDLFDLKVADEIFVNSAFQDSILHYIAESELYSPRSYAYSDIGFILLGKWLEKRNGAPLDEQAKEFLFEPIGAGNMLYNPLSRFSRQNIIPTEEDRVLRKQLIDGYAHDPSAALMGGVAGNAGVFSNAEDLAKVMQMYLNTGSYGGVEFFKENTVKTFTKKSSGQSRRALGFDKPEPDIFKPGPVIKGISEESFGHTGFTGTIAWADPAEQIVYVFLSNRIHPHQYNTKISELDIRQKIQQVIYDAIQ